ncbi:hypothetical protein VNO78_04674 [Psophocarpus tetragonolobus]|uniref:Pre-rRNA-processing protein TSR2 homolog n=1 Tax=Psophocarpus tetragonolobus TaxID=3891 RepID=A0AAN9T3U6_PSOTE
MAPQTYDWRLGLQARRRSSHGHRRSSTPPPPSVNLATAAIVQGVKHEPESLNSLCPQPSKYRRPSSPLSTAVHLYCRRSFLLKKGLVCCGERVMEGSRRLQGQSLGVFCEGINLLLFRWSALRTAVENEWGGRESHVKADQLASDIVSWFTQSKEPLYIDDLEDILDQGMLSLNVEVEDGSIEEVAEKLMVMHEEFLEGNFNSFENLRKANLEQAARPQVTQIVNDDEDDTNDDGDNDENMIVDDNSSNMNQEISISVANTNSVNRPVNQPLPKVSGEADDGWVVVSNRRNKGRKN